MVYIMLNILKFEIKNSNRFWSEKPLNTNNTSEAINYRYYTGMIIAFKIITTFFNIFTKIDL